MRPAHARRRRAIIALVLVAWSTVGCTATVAHQAPYPALASPRDDVSVTLASGEVYRLWSAVVRNDSIVGVHRTPVRPGDIATEDEQWRRYRESPVSVPLSGVRAVEMRQADGARTTALVVGLAGAVVVLLAMIASSLDMGLSGGY